MGKYTPRFNERVQRIIVKKIEPYDGHFRIYGVTAHEVLWIVANGAILLPDKRYPSNIDYWKGLVKDSNQTGHWRWQSVEFTVDKDSKLHEMLAERCFDFLKNPA